MLAVEHPQSGNNFDPQHESHGNRCGFVFGYVNGIAVITFFVKLSHSDEHICHLAGAAPRQPCDHAPYQGTDQCSAPTDFNYPFNISKGGLRHFFE